MLLFLLNAIVYLNENKLIAETKKQVLKILSKKCFSKIVLNIKFLLDSTWSLSCWFFKLVRKFLFSQKFLNSFCYNFLEQFSYWSRLEITLSVSAPCTFLQTEKLCKFATKTVSMKVIETKFETSDFITLVSRTWYILPDIREMIRLFKLGIKEVFLTKIEFFFIF